MSRPCPSRNSSGLVVNSVLLANSDSRLHCATALDTVDSLRRRQLQVTYWSIADSAQYADASSADGPRTSRPRTRGALATEEITDAIAIKLRTRQVSRVPRNAASLQERTDGPVEAGIAVGWRRIRGFTAHLEDTPLPGLSGLPPPGDRR